MSWTDARIAELARLWAAGVSAGGIAEALGDVSRSAVLGKLHRMKLLGSRKAAAGLRRFDAAEPAPPRVALAPPPRAAPPPPRKADWRVEVFAPLAGSAPRPWLTRAFGECAFPVSGEGVDVRSCCAPAKARSAYCPAHHAVVFRPAAPAGGAEAVRRWAETVERWAA